MDIEHVSIGMDVFISNEQSPYFKQDGRVLSIYSDYGLKSQVVNIRVQLDDGVVVGGLSAADIA